MGGQSAAPPVATTIDDSHPRDEETAQSSSKPGKSGIISDASRDAARARLLVLSEAGDDAELLQKVSEANACSTPVITPSPAAASNQSGDVKSDCCRSKLMAMADTLPPDPAATAP